MATRIERDTFGEIEVPAQRLWEAQTQRSLQFFEISTETLPPELVQALVRVKRAAAEVNAELGLLDAAIAGAIRAAGDEVLAGQHDAQFPLSVWQTGSGTQTHMNVNEVLANRASELLGGNRGVSRMVHALDHVNRGQSSNDVLPTAMHVAAALAVERRLHEPLAALRATLQAKVEAFADIVKIGRTHGQDATPLTVGQEFSGFVAQLDIAAAAIMATQPALLALAIGGTAVGAGLNTHPEFGERVGAKLAAATGLAFVAAPNRFAALAGHEPLLALHGALKTLAAALHKIAHDLRWLGSGPRTGIGELTLPENGPGSSIMPGKVNPTQCEMLAMVAAQVFGNDVTVTFGAAGGNLELNVHKPLIAHNVLQSIRLLADGIASLDAHCARGIEPDRERIDELLQSSLMLVTALVPYIGYERAAAIAHQAHRQRTSLREAAVASGALTAAQLDAWVQPAAMTRPEPP
jgi:fumarate hydratase class II